MFDWKTKVKSQLYTFPFNNINKMFTERISMSIVRSQVQRRRPLVTGQNHSYTFSSYFTVISHKVKVRDVEMPAFSECLLSVFSFRCVNIEDICTVLIFINCLMHLFLLSYSGRLRLLSMLLCLSVCVCDDVYAWRRVNVCVCVCTRFSGFYLGYYGSNFEKKTW